MLDRRTMLAGTVAAAATTIPLQAPAAETSPAGMQFYHDFSVLGLKVPQLPGAYIANQQNKEPLVTGYMLYAMGKIKAQSKPVTIGELFCADAYYSFVARRFGADQCDAFDSDRDGYLEQARVISRLLNETKVNIHKIEQKDMSPDYKASVIINAGGLYHVTNPLEVLEQSYAMAQDYLVVQTVVSLANESPDYFETPAPGWTWGSRFSFAFLKREMEKRGYKIIDSDRNVLAGNDRPEDRGSAYFLISKHA